MCGYDKSIVAFDFHHVDPSRKDFTIAKSRLWKFDDLIRSELDKCILLCRNCHAEEHNRLWEEKWRARRDSNPR